MIKLYLPYLAAAAIGLIIGAVIDWLINRNKENAYGL